MNENTTPEPAEEAVEEVEGVKVSEVVEEPVEEVVPVEEEVEEEAEEEAEEEVEVESVAEEALMTINDVKDRFTGIVNNARAAGIAGVTNRGFAALEGFFGALAGDKDQRPPKR